MASDRTAEEVFDEWALDYHVAGMEDDHRPSVMEAFGYIEESDGQFLEVGIGNGYGLHWIANHQFKQGHCTGIDVSANMITVARQRTAESRNVTLVQADFLSLAPPDIKRPDVIFSMEVFYYLPSMAEGIRHALEILNPGGMLMVLVNHFVERKDSHDWGTDLNTPMQLWSAAEYAAAFAETGFIDVQQRYVGIPGDVSVRKVNPGTLATWARKPF